MQSYADVFDSYPSQASPPTVTMPLHLTTLSRRDLLTHNMSVRSFSLCLTVIALAAPLLAQKTAYKAPRTPDGAPDLQGIWTNQTLTALERPADLAGKQFFTAAEADAYAKRLVELNNADRRDGGAAADVSRAYNDFWWDRGTKMAPTLRTSLVIDPKDGKIPALTPEAQKRNADRAAYRRNHASDGPEDRSLAERCLIWPTGGPPMMPSFYNNNYEFVQSPGYLAIWIEMIHDVRMIPIAASAKEARAHPPTNVRLWMGDPVGHWEGDMLVVDSTNFTANNGFRGSGENLHLVERFTRAGPALVLYEFTMDDPEIFVKPWSVQVPMTRTEGPLLEYACHEGNYAMEGILAGARKAESAK